MNVDASIDTPPLKAKSLGNALEKLGQKIATGELLPGEQIRQQEMAEQLGISRVPLREALNVLADQGLLMHMPNKGYFVVKRPLSELLQISRMLDLLEDELFTSITWPQTEAIDALTFLNGQMKKSSVSENWTPLIALNREFHWKIYSFSSYKLIQEELKRLWAMVDPYLATKMTEPKARNVTLREHQEIIDALKSEDYQRLILTIKNHRRSAAQGMRGVKVS
jgi:DNA-binding GntR family transcriptional regulator